jgi:hypothetical protein
VSATLDILDALAPDYAEYINLPDKYHFKASGRRIKISPKYWNDNHVEINQHQYNWTEVKYTELKAHLDANPVSANGVGIYFFIIKPDNLVYSLPCYVFYVGVAGETDGQRPLRDRLYDYLQLSQVKKREAVHLTLQQYYNNTYVVYSKVNLTPVNLRKLETAFHGFYYPWAGKRDFPVEMKQQQKAWGEI